MRSKLIYEELLEVTNKLELSDYEKEETEEFLRNIKNWMRWNQWWFSLLHLNDKNSL